METYLNPGNSGFAEIDPRMLEQFGGRILLVGINYDVDAKQRVVRIRQPHRILTAS